MDYERDHIIRTRREIYQKIVRILTDYELPESEEDKPTADDFYRLLTEIQNRWEDTITGGL